MELPPPHARLVEAARRWAEAEPRVRALLLGGSLGRGEGDELSDVDLFIVAQPRRLAELWAERRAIAERLGRVLGVFRDLPSADPMLAIALYDGPLKVDLFFREEAVEDSPWVREGVTPLVDKNGTVRRGPEPKREAPLDEHHADVAELDAHAWDFALWLWTKLHRGESWLVYTRLATFLETIVLAAWSEAVAGAGWRGALGAGRRLPTDVLDRIGRALPRSADPEELLRALRAQASLYAAARSELLRDRRPADVSDELMRQVLERIASDPLLEAVRR